MSSDALERDWRPHWPCPVGALLVQHRRGVQDPTWRHDDSGWWRASRTPVGAATLHVVAAGDVVRVRAWGSGAAWAVDQLPELLGASDDVSGFVPGDPLVERAHGSAPHWRLGRTGLVLDSLVPSIIEQKVTAVEAFRSYRRLVLTHGEPAPGPVHGPELWLPPDAKALRAIPSWGWLGLGIDAARARPLAAVARVAESLERFATADGPQLDRALTSLPGIGRWTSAEVRARVLGDADAVSFGDYHVAADVGWAVRGQPFDDRELEEWLAPWPGHRGRVSTLVRAYAGGRPRRAPRMAPRTHLPVRGVRGGDAGARGRTR